MLLAVAGLNEQEISSRTEQLGEDWSEFPPAERAAFAYARKLSLTPWEMNAADFDGLVSHFGKSRAMDVIWWTCRCHYMTRVADAFQLPLEEENAFSSN